MLCSCTIIETVSKLLCLTTLSVWLIWCLQSEIMPVWKNERICHVFWIGTPQIAWPQFINNRSFLSLYAWAKRTWTSTIIVRFLIHVSRCLWFTSSRANAKLSHWSYSHPAQLSYYLWYLFFSSSVISRQLSFFYFFCSSRRLPCTRRLMWNRGTKKYSLVVEPRALRALCTCRTRHRSAKTVLSRLQPIGGMLTADESTDLSGVRLAKFVVSYLVGWCGANSVTVSRFRFSTTQCVN